MIFLEKKDGVKNLVSLQVLRDIACLMEVPFLSLSKKTRQTSLTYTPSQGCSVTVTPSSDYGLVNIYDWDIIILIAGKIQQILNLKSDIPSRTVIFQRQYLLKALQKHNGQKEKKSLENSLNRLHLSMIETALENKDFCYGQNLRFIDSWGYTQREDIREISITLSSWLFDIICQKTLLKVDETYFSLTSGLKRFLYRVARKHVGHNAFWEFSIERLYEKSGSEREFRKFKSDLKKAVFDNDLPGYSLEWSKKNNRHTVIFTNLKKIFTFCTFNMNKDVEKIFPRRLFRTNEEAFLDI